uniref:uncharacterized protein n=1 Tax=Semicossyphus pulcher TaxID=241346 RepID=UPI0037E8A229
MNLCSSSLFLVVGLFLSSSAMTPEECKPLITPLSMADPSSMFGRVNFIMGYNDNEIFNDILKITQSSWMDMSLSLSNPDEVVMAQENRINGTCIVTTASATIDGDTAKVSLVNVTSTFQSLPTCEGCLALSINSTSINISKLLHVMNLSSTSVGPQFTSFAVYLMANTSTVQDSDLEHFKKQASCLGFTGEPGFHYDPKNGFCEEGEFMKIIN